MSATADSMLSWVPEPDISSIVTEDDAPLDNFPSEKQQRLLTEPLYSSWSGPPLSEDGAKRPFVAAANVGLFASVNEPAIVPDVLLSVDVELREDLWQKKNRTYFIWEMGKPPNVVIEIVSNTEGDELGGKRRRYAKMGIGYYAVYDPQLLLGGPALRSFERRGDLYVPMQRPWFDSVGLGLTLWKGTFEGRLDTWLRWCADDAGVIPTGAERAEGERKRAEAEHARAERLAARLRALGIDPDEGG